MILIDGKKIVFRNSAKFTGKHLHATVLTKKTLAQVFSCEFCEISKNTFLTEHLLINTSVQCLELIIPEIVNVEEAIYFKGSLPLIRTNDLNGMQECLLTEIKVNNEN